jgi:hypothetical protein
MTTETTSKDRFEEFERYDEASREYGVVECGAPDCTRRARYALMVYPPEGGSEGHAGLLCEECLQIYADLFGGVCG